MHLRAHDYASLSLHRLTPIHAVCTQFVDFTGTKIRLLTVHCGGTDSADLVVPENRDSAQKQPGGGSAANSASNSASKSSAPGSGAGASNSGSACKHKRSSAAGASNWLDSAGKENAAKNIETADGAPPPTFSNLFGESDCIMCVGA